MEVATKRRNWKQLRLSAGGRACQKRNQTEVCAMDGGMIGVMKEGSREADGSL